MSKSEFVDLICSIWNEGISSLNIISGFKTCGIFPVNQDKYPVDRLNPVKLQKYLDFKENSVSQIDLLQSNPVSDSITAGGSSEVSSSSSQHRTPLANVDLNQPSTSHQSFETLLLQKIGTTAAPKLQRMQIKPDAAVVTSEEYIENIKAREESKKKPTGKRKKSGKANKSSERTRKSKKKKPNENRASRGRKY
ncbi:uncharacterized protein LOC117652034 [Thrips palmi]|uniref:Uncharacterized protein LOC117652034 n=1 Tax=Thrips palmi TaxID=161013 RepID=A0A6P9A3U2_THRPL|nr:uncharacterized protein LOC117652034 [Thrips palmi]